MNDVEKNVGISASIDRVWAALTDPPAIRGWMGEDSAVTVDLKVGGRYRLFGGETTGTFTLIENPSRLEYTWRQGEWPKEWADSLVLWKLESDGQGTRVHLTHGRFPNAEERDSHDEGWDLYFIGPMKEWLEGSG